MLRKIAVFTVLASLAACSSDGGDKGDDPVVAGDASDAQETPESDAGVSPTQDAASAVDANGDATASPDAGARDAAAEASQGMDGGDASATTDTGVADAAADASVDAANDAGTPDATVVLPVFTLTVRRGASQALAQAPVFFHDQSGALIAEVTTDAEGHATTTAAPAMVTIIAPKTGGITAPIVEPRLYTITALAADDKVVLQLPFEGVEQPGYLVSINATTALPAAPATAKIQVFGGCPGCALVVKPVADAPPFPLKWNSAWPVQAQNTLLGVGYSAGNWPTAFAWSTDVAAFGSSAVAVSLAGWKVPQNAVLTAKNLGTDQFAAGLLLLYSQGVPFDPVGFGPIAMPEGSATRTQNIPTPPGFAEEQAALLDVQVSAATRASLAWRGAVSLTPELDAAGALPGTTAMAFDRTVPERPTLSWTNPAPLAAAADGSAALIEWAGPSASVAGPAWVIITPASVTSAKLPALPAARRAFLTGAAPALYISHFGSSKLQNYREFLKEPLRPTIEGTSYHMLARDLPQQSSTQVTSYIAP